MGHIRLGVLPKTKRWKEVISLLGFSDDPGLIADKTAEAAEKGLELAKSDEGIVQTIFLLIKTIYAAKEKDFDAGLREIGISVSPDASLLDVVSGFDDSLDRQLRDQGKRTDLAEMARQSALDTLMELAGSAAGNLFGVSKETTQAELKKYSTTKEFGRVGQTFFGKFLNRFLDYHLSRELPNHIGQNQTFKNVQECDAFKHSLSLHCLQTARIVKEFSGCWPSAADYRGNLDLTNIRTRFLPVAIKKIRAELKQRSSHE